MVLHTLQCTPSLYHVCTEQVNLNQVNILTMTILITCHKLL